MKWLAWTFGRALIVIVIALVASARAAYADGVEERVDWGFAAKARRAWVTPYVQKLFMGDVPGTATMDGVGFDFSRRKGPQEVVFGFGYDRLDAMDGYYLEKGGDPTMQGDVDYVTFRKPHWYTVEVSAISHAQLHKFLELRFGGGIGLGVVRGAVRKTDAICTSANLEQSCMIDPMAVEVNHKADIPPVLPVVNAIVGLQLRPTRWLHIHVDAGLHTVPFVTAGVSLYLW
jgi:hypothetical protein